MPLVDPEKRKAYQKALYQTNREKRKTYQKDWRAANPEYMNDYNHSFAGVVRDILYRDRKALERLDQQVREGIENL